MSIHGIDMNKTAMVVGVERERSWRTLWLFRTTRTFYTGRIFEINTVSDDEAYTVSVTFKEYR